MTRVQHELLWVIVKVESGIPAFVEAFKNKASATKREQVLRKDMHPENDEVGVFEVRI